MSEEVRSLPVWKKIMYGCGQFGWSLASYGVGNLMTYFYLPPGEADSAVFPAFFYQGGILFGLTLIGLITFGGRIFDAITDPIIAGLSDTSKSKFGKRRKFLLIGALPFALTSILVFTPIFSPERFALSSIPVYFSLFSYQSIINAIWVGVIILLFYLAFTFYITPFMALMSELGHTPKERLQLSTIISVFWALGFAVGSSVYFFQSLFEDLGLSSVNAFQLVMVIFGIVSFIFLLIPIIFVNEHKYCHYRVSKEKPFQAVKSALKNYNFRIFTLSDLVYFLALTIIQIGISYYVIALLELDKSLAFVFMVIMFVSSFSFYVPVNIIANKIGKKKVMIFGFFMFAIGYVFVIFLGKFPFIPPFVQGVIVMVWCGIPMAIFGLLPNAIVADIAEYDGIKTNNYKAGVFFGARGLVQKVGMSLGNLIFPSLLLLGKSSENDLGVRLSGVVALIFCVIGLLLFFQFDEKDILKTLATRENLSKEELAKIKEE